LLQRSKQTKRHGNSSGTTVERQDTDLCGQETENLIPRCNKCLSWRLRADSYAGKQFTSGTMTLFCPHRGSSESRTRCAGPTCGWVLSHSPMVTPGIWSSRRPRYMDGSKFVGSAQDLNLLRRWEWTLIFLVNTPHEVTEVSEEAAPPTADMSDCSCGRKVRCRAKNSSTSWTQC
jgi:hypothetical protein